MNAVVGRHRRGRRDGGRRRDDPPDHGALARVGVGRDEGDGRCRRAGGDDVAASGDDPRRGVRRHLAREKKNDS